MNQLKYLCGILFFSVSLVLALGYGAASLTPFISPKQCWWMGLLAMGFPVLFVSLAFFALFSLFYNRKWALILFLWLFVGYKNIIAIFAFRVPAKFDLAKNPGDIRVMGWNVRGYNTTSLSDDTSNSPRHLLFRYIEKYQPDIVCMQESSECDSRYIPSNIRFIKDTLHYPYCYFAQDYIFRPTWGDCFAGVAIASKLPLQNIQHLPFPGKTIPESIVSADITRHGITRRVIVTHLQSIHLKNQDPGSSQPWEVTEDSAVIYSNDKIRKLRYYQAYHCDQAQFLKKQMDSSPYPVIFSGDLNEVPSSFVYHQISADMKDAFLHFGLGLGRTFSEISPTLRIDALLVSPGISIQQYQKDNVLLSDHFPQMMDIRW